MNLTIFLFSTTIVVIFLTLLFNYISEKIKIFCGYKKYKYTKILSHGMHDEFMFHKNDEEALKENKHFEFVEIIKPYKKRIKPIK